MWWREVKKKKMPTLSPQNKYSRILKNMEFFLTKDTRNLVLVEHYTIRMDDLLLNSATFKLCKQKS